MTKLIYKIMTTYSNNNKLSLTIYHGKMEISTTFFDNGDITYYTKSKRIKLYIRNEHYQIIVSYYIKINELTGIEYLN